MISTWGVTLSNDLEWSKPIATITNKANSKLSFLHRNLNGCPEKLKQTAYFSLIHSFMEYGVTVWDPYQKYNCDTVERVQRRAARFVKSKYSRYSSVSDMLDVLGWTPLSQMRQKARLILFYKIINGLAQVPFECVHVEVYKGTRRKHNMKFRQIGHTTSQYGQPFFHKTITDILPASQIETSGIDQHMIKICLHDVKDNEWKLQRNRKVTVYGERNVVVVYPLPWPLLVGGVRCSRLWSTSQLLRPSGQQCIHSGGVCPQIQGRQCGAYVGAVEEMMCGCYTTKKNILK